MDHLPSRPRKGLRRARAALLGAVAACAVAAVTTGSARAQTTMMTLDHGVMDLGAFPGVEIVTPANPISVTVTPETETDFHVSPGDFQFPHFTGNQSGITIELDTVLAETLTGTYDPATGAMTTDPANFDVTIQLDTPLGTSTCVMDVAHGNPVPMSYSTEATSPYAGDRFDPAPLSDPLVNGAIAASWDDLPASTRTSGTSIGDLCPFLDAQKAGPGGIWLSNGIAPPTTPSTPPRTGGAISTPVPTVVTLPPKKKRKKCRKGFKKVKVNGKVKCRKRKK